MTTCREVSAWIGTFVDGELPLDHAVNTECHVTQCHSCAERVRFERALRSSVKKAVQDQSEPSPSFEQRLERVLLAERINNRVYACTPTSSVRSASALQEHFRAGQQQVNFSVKKFDVTRSVASEVISSPLGTLRWRTLLPVAAVAAGAILWGGVQNQLQNPDALKSASTSDLRLSELDSYFGRNG